MSSSGLQALPADLFHLLSAELSDRLDFSTLYNCAVSSRQLANAGAVNALYRISAQAPVASGGEGLPLAEQELVVQRWSILWRTITLSAFGKTVFPYCRHLRYLDLRNLGQLLEDDKFRGKISKHFFSGELAGFHHVLQTPVGKGRAARLDVRKIIAGIGNVITQNAPLLEALSEPADANIFSHALLEWAPRLPKLRSLDLWDGKALADETLQTLLHAHCPNLSSLRIYLSVNEDADHALATFISGMQENQLRNFENIGSCRIGAETCLALNHHGRSLESLKLCLANEDLPALGLLQGCTALEILALASTERNNPVDLKATQNDAYLEIIDWLAKCSSLKEIGFTDFVSAPDLLLPVLLNKDVTLQKLQINANENTMYIVKDHHDFHQALSQQPGLRRLLLRADPDPISSSDDIDTLMNAFCSLKELRELNLIRISDYFSNKHIADIAEKLSNLEDLCIGGYGIDDKVFAKLAELRNLRSLTFNGITSFSVHGILDFIDKLGEGNRGLLLSIDAADPDSAIPQECQDMIRDVIAQKLEGRFDYTLLRDPNVPEFDTDDSD
ncbi:uncharacterized protein MYCFIDRAFT_147409 [Pseudocercospora fijiensis CIRAD86]|uniref:F-box domain-containing protein n=1 Tax=Pseudocercospora fijiensis (strain CIRAD86) TaxID=383855 RepID=M2ZXM4_PSEFD|nr:uncharacterized protein MYCFIDRAFT_147409 [Pseudocercospora fijiensis CIRAD86]EME76846.1 hypothetical protein MYCFIDRAFT_147409 [Pseudocercospora fijiensis CIRAD86]